MKKGDEMKRQRDIIDLTDDEDERDLQEVLELSPYSQSSSSTKNTSSRSSIATRAIPDTSRGYTIWQAPPSPSMSPMRRAPAMSMPELDLDREEENEEAKENDGPLHPKSNADLKYLRNVLQLIVLEMKGLGIQAPKEVRWFKQEPHEKYAELCKMLVDRINVNFVMVVGSDGKPTVVEECVEETADGLYHRFVVRSKMDCKDVFSTSFNHLLGESPMTIWMTHPDARQVDKVVFSVEQTTDKVFNLYRGLQISRESVQHFDSEQLDDICAPVLDHIKNIWFRNKQGDFDYMMDWLAHAVQRPGVKMRTVPVVKAGQGAGKGIILSHFMKRIIGPSGFMQVSDVDEVSSGFSADCCKTALLTFLDEATFSGDKKQASKLKGLITESTKRFETKFVNPIYIENLSNYFVASNYDQIVYVELDDRRFWCFEADSRWAGKETPEAKEYFARILDVPVNAFAALLYNRDISNFSPGQFPETEYIKEQKLRNLSPLQAFVEQMLSDCAIPGTDMFYEQKKMSDDENESDLSELTTSKDHLYQCYKRFCIGARRFDQMAVFYRTLHKMVSMENGSKKAKGMKRTQMVVIDIRKSRDMFKKSVKEDKWEWNVELSDIEA